jgi:hypothetical protein
MELFQPTLWDQQEDKWIPFLEARLIAREFARCLRIKTSGEWLQTFTYTQDFANQYNLNVPRHPHFQYNSAGWINWDDWLGLKIDYKDFEATRKFIKTLDLKSKEDWINFCKTKKPINIYRYPEIAYCQNEWKGWEHWQYETDLDPVNYFIKES